jgi:hypothetical protein
MKPLNRTELAVARALGVARSLNANDDARNLYESCILVQLGRDNPGFDYDMFEARVKEYEATKRAER